MERGQLNGLEYRLKDEDSLKRKMATALLEDPELTPERALANIRDSLRYTVEIPTRDYSHGVQQAVDELRARGFETVSFKNTWDGSGYIGINSVPGPSTGQTFEVQFHTPESLAAKMDTHILYEKGRLPGISREEFDAIQAAQNELFDRVPIPHGIDSIRLTMTCTACRVGSSRKWEGPRRHPAAPCRQPILDMHNANQAAIDDVKSIVEQYGWSDRVVWYP